MTDVSIVIVNYNTRELLLDCIRSIHESEKGLAFEVIVSDNGSADGSADAVREQYPPGRSRVTVLENGENLGFARANNAGIEIAKGHYVLLLNSDTIVHENAISKMAAYLEEKPDAGAVGCTLLNADGSVQHSVTNYPTFGAMLHRYSILKYAGLFKRARDHYRARHFDYNTDQEVEQLLGAVMMIRADLLKRLDGLDGNLFLYFEDPDLCLRIRQAGLEVRYAPIAKITHLEGASSAKIRSSRLKLIFFRSLFYYFRKHRGRSATFLFSLVFKPAVLLYEMVQGIKFGIGAVFAMIKGERANVLQRLKNAQSCSAFVFVHGWRFVIL